MGYRSCEPDRFSATLGQMLDDYYRDFDDAVEMGVEKTTKQAKRNVTKYAKDSAFKKGKTGQDYVKSFSSKIDRHGHETTGEVGSKKFPGLVHLLEKGHAKIGGGRTTAYPHMAPAFEDAKKDFVPNIEKELDKL